MIDDAFPVISEISVERWLVASGFEFNPFAFLDAAADPRISAYLVGHDAFAAIWGNWPAIALAPAGGGKTALRMQVTRACWAGPDTGYPFPIPYTLGTISGYLPSTLDEHLCAILQSATLSLLHALQMRSHWWENLDNAARRSIRGLLDIDLPISLAHYLVQTEDTLAFPFRDTYPVSLSNTSRERDRRISFSQQLINTPAGVVPASLTDRLQMLVELLLGPLGLSAVYLLVDGVDGFPETAESPAMTVQLLDPLLSSARGWGERGIFVKGFVPVDTAVALNAWAVSGHLPHQITIKWSRQLLAEVLRQRVYVATAGAFGSLDAICAPSLRDTETRLAHVAKPLPRELLVLVNRFIWEHIRHSGCIHQLDERDLQAAAEWYESLNAQGDLSTPMSK